MAQALMRGNPTGGRRGGTSAASRKRFRPLLLETLESRALLATITQTGSIAALGEVDLVTVPLQAGETLEVRPLDRVESGIAYAPSVEVGLPDGALLSASYDGHSYKVVAPVTGDYSGRISSDFVQRGFAGAYTVTFISTAFGGTTESEANNIRVMADLLTTSASFRGTLSSSSDVDYFSFTAAAGQTVAVKLANLPASNPAVRLRDAGDNVLAFGLDGNGWAYAFSASGTYYLSVEKDNSAGVVTGEYVGSISTVTNAVLETNSGEVFDNAAVVPALEVYAVPKTYLKQTPSGAAGLVGSYVDSWLGWRMTMDDWRSASDVRIAGTRVDPLVNFTTATWGARSPLHLTGGTDMDWEGFSVQWDGYITIPRSGTHLYTRSDDGSRMWIDLNNDGAFDNLGAEFIDDNYGYAQAATTGPSSVALNVGTYRIRIQYEEGVDANEMYLAWDDAAHSAGALPGPTAAAAGVLSGLNDVDVFAVNLAAGSAYDLGSEANTQTAATQDRYLAVANEFGQVLAYAVAGNIVHVDVAPSSGGRHFVLVRAATPAGLGGYACTVKNTGTFPTQRDIPLYYFDFSGTNTYFDWPVAAFTRTDLEPLIMGMFEAGMGVNDIDVTTTAPATDAERVAVAVGDVANPPFGGLGGGWYGYRRPTGNALIDVSNEGSWTQHNNGLWAYAVTRHEAGHGMGMPHIRHALDIMSADNQLFGFPPGQTFPWGEHPLPGRQVYRVRDYLDWVSQAGRIASETSNDTLATAQNLDGYLAEMSTDSESRNDKAVLVGAISDPTDVDTFRITAAVGETWEFDVDAAEFQSPLDATLTLKGASGLTLAQSTQAYDHETGLNSLDPALTYTFSTAGTYYIQVTADQYTWGSYRLKVTPPRARDGHGPRVLASWPNGGQVVDGTRQLTFWLNDQLDPDTLSATNIVVRNQGNVVQPGTAWFDPLDAILVWHADSQLAPGTYTITLRSGTTGLKDLHGNPLDGETTGTLTWPQISGDGIAGGDFVTRFTVNAADNQAAGVSWSDYRRHTYNHGLFTLHFSDEIDYGALFTNPNLTLRRTGGDGQFGTADDVPPIRLAVDKLGSLSDPHVYVYTLGVPDPGSYRIEGTVLDAAGHPVTVSQDFVVTNSESGGVVRPLNVSSLNVQPGTTHKVGLDRVDVTFSGTVNLATLTPGNFRLRYSPNPSFFDADDVWVADADGQIAWDATRNTATLQPAAPLVNGYYLVELNGRSGGITDTVGRLLDGEFLNATTPGCTIPTVWQDSPSGDGLPGGDFRAFFAVRVPNLPPSVALTNTTTSLAEDTSLASRLKVADIVVTDDGVGTNTLQLTGADAALFEIETGVLYLRAGTGLDYETNPQLDVTVEVDDAAVGTRPDGSAPLSIAMVDVNEPPVASDQVVQLVEDTSRAITLQALDPEGDFLTYFVVSPPQHGPLSGAAPNLAYKPDADFNGPDSFTFLAHAGGADSSLATVSISVSPVNDAPVRTAGTLTPISVAEDSANGTAVALGLAGLSYGPGGGADESAQTLTYTLTVIPAYVQIFKADDATQVNVGGTLSAGELPGLKYKTVPNANGTVNLTWTVTDSGSATAPNVNTLTENLAITVTAVNDAPVRTAGTLTPINMAEDSANSTAVTLGLSGVTYGPGGGVDEAGQTLTYILTAIPAYVQIFKSDGTTPVLVNGTGTEMELQNLKYKTVADANGTGNLTWTVTDDGTPAQTLTENLALTVTAANDSPVFTSSAAPSVPENTTAVVTLAATDADLPAQSVTFSITGGADQAKFEIVGGNQLRFNTAPDYESPTDAGADNVYEVSVTADDGAGGTTVQNLSVTVTPVNDNSPVFTSSAAPSVPENTTAVVTLAATDADLPAQSVTFSITGGADEARFEIVSGQLQFKAAPDYESPADAGGNNVYEVSVTTDDGAGGTTVQNMSVTVTPMNDNSPAFTSSATQGVPENTTTVVTLAASDADLPAQSVSFSITDGADQAVFTIVNGSELRFQTAPDYETPTDSDTDNIYLVQVTAADGAGRATVQNLNVTVLLTSWHNPRHPCDVNDDGSITPLDVLVLINDINAHGSRRVTAPPTPTPPPYLDPSGDGSLTPLDVLQVINYINTYGAGPVPAVAGGEGEHVGPSDYAAAAISASSRVVGFESDTGGAVVAWACPSASPQPVWPAVFPSGRRTVSKITQPRIVADELRGYELATSELEDAISAIAGEVAQACSPQPGRPAVRGCQPVVRAVDRG